jgi:hypothetical protein
LLTARTTARRIAAETVDAALDDSRPLGDAAERLGTSAATVRSTHRRPTLGPDQRLPTWQFIHGRVVPGID